MGKDKLDKDLLLAHFSKITAFGLTLAMIIHEVKSEFSQDNQSAYQTLASNNTTCLVDRCASCPDFTNLTCLACQTGYYLRSYTDGIKPYNACWSVSKMLLGLFSLMLLGLLTCTMCFLCYKCGQKASNIRGNPYI